MPAYDRHRLVVCELLELVGPEQIGVCNAQKIRGGVFAVIFLAQKSDVVPLATSIIGFAGTMSAGLFGLLRINEVGRQVDATAKETNGKVDVAVAKVDAVHETVNGNADKMLANLSQAQAEIARLHLLLGRAQGQNEAQGEEPK
ncbi:MAG: hypothetical protein GIX02_00590 [Candidatus Eremiobacteraeota bacterium]|nr:hypothetical protein [Candidatus Eremiobacteraeota bacterium]